MELRTGRNRVDIHLKENGYSGKTGTVYLFIRRQENIQGISIGNITFRNNQADFRYEQAEENIGQTPWRIMQMHGILIMIDERAAFLSQWDEQPVDTTHFVVWEAKDGKGQADEATQKQETEAAPVEKAVPASDTRLERKPADTPAKQSGTESVGTEKASAPSGWASWLGPYFSSRWAASRSVRPWARPSNCFITCGRRRLCQSPMLSLSLPVSSSIVERLSTFQGKFVEREKIPAGAFRRDAYPGGFSTASSLKASWPRCPPTAAPRRWPQRGCCRAHPPRPE